MTVQVDSLVRALDIVDQTPPRCGASRIRQGGMLRCCACFGLTREDGRSYAGAAYPKYAKCCQERCQTHCL